MKVNLNFFNRKRLEDECDKLIPAEEQKLADEGLADYMMMLDI